MSFSAKRYQGNKLEISLEEALFEEGYEYSKGKLEDIFQQNGYRTWDLSEQEIAHIVAVRDNFIEFKDLLATMPKKSRGARWMASQVFYSSRHNFDLKNLCDKWSVVRELRNWEACNYDLCKKLDIDAKKLIYIGIRFAWQAERFCSLYEQVYNPKFKWGGHYQVRPGKVKAIALTSNYNRLPVWVKKAMILSSEWIREERIGNIWNFGTCAKAWKHAPNLPKALAKKVGNLSPKARMLAQYAWDFVYREFGFKSLRQFNQEGWINCLWDGEKYADQKVERKAIINAFWEKLNELLAKPLRGLIDIPSPYVFSKLAEYELGLPNDCLAHLKKEDNNDVKLKAIATYASPEKACKFLFGVAGKRTAMLFKAASENNWRWASSIAFGNADAVQKILEAKDIINFQQESVKFLLALPMQSRIRLLSATTFKYRGQTHLITDDHVRDTGYLWKNIKAKPNLGRVRCWFSAHEQLSAAYVKEIPNEPLPINPNWRKVNGLCAVDGSWELEFPRDVSRLKYYGQILKNCVGGYGEAIKSGRSIIFVVKEQGIITHCVEVNSGNIRQFYKANNSRSDYQIENSVSEALRQARLI